MGVAKEDTNRKDGSNDPEETQESPFLDSNHVINNTLMNDNL
jgi:hypothetical protein